MAEKPPERIHPDAVRAAGDVVEALHELGFTCSLAYIEAAGFIDEQHYLANIDAVGDWIEHPDALQRKLNQIDETTSEHADELVVAAPGGHDIGLNDDLDQNVFWEFEAIIRITDTGG